MAVIRPFKALRPVPELAAKVAALPMMLWIVKKPGKW